jgi:hypothetical protein
LLVYAPSTTRYNSFIKRNFCRHLH